MQFKDLKEGYSVFVFDKAALSVTEGKVTGKTAPHFDFHYPPTELVVDVSISFGGQQQTFALKEAAEVGYADNLSICTDRDALLREIEAKRAQEETITKQVEDAIQQLDAHKANVQKCAELQGDFNPSLKEKKATEERMAKMESSMAELTDMIKGLLTQINRQ